MLNSRSLTAHHVSCRRLTLRSWLNLQCVPCKCTSTLCPDLLRMAIVASSALRSLRVQLVGASLGAKAFGHSVCARS